MEGVNLAMEKMQFAKCLIMCFLIPLISSQGPLFLHPRFKI